MSYYKAYAGVRKPSTYDFLWEEMCPFTRIILRNMWGAQQAPSVIWHPYIRPPVIGVQLL